MMQCANEAKRALNPICIFSPYRAYKGWDAKMIKKTIRACQISENEVKLYSTYWLMKYMFKADVLPDRFTNKSLTTLLQSIFTSKGRKAKQIVKKFIKIGKDLSHDTPLQYKELQSMGLNVKCADGKLLELMRENYILSDKLFERSSIKKLYISADKNFFNFVVQKNM